MTHIVGCIDGSRAAPAVCDYAAWASRRMEAPLMFFHVLDDSRYPVEPDMAGNIGLGTREYLMEELAELDEKRSRIAMEHGRHMLEAAAERARGAGIEEVHQRQRHGDLSQCLLDIESDIRLGHGDPRRKQLRAGHPHWQPAGNGHPQPAPARCTGTRRIQRTPERHAGL